MEAKLSELKKMSNKKSERFYFKTNAKLDKETMFCFHYHVTKIDDEYFRTGWVDLDTHKHEMLKKATALYGVEFIPEKMFLDRRKNVTT